jgi:small conductance mechanosensitive channel
VLGIVGLIVFGKVGLRLLHRRIVKAADDGDDSRESGKEKRAKTVADLVLKAGNAVTYVIAGVMALRLFGVDTVPILAGAGVIGVAIGVSMQALVKDLVAGMFIVVENQYAIGDKVKIGESEGVVHRMGLRTTVLLDDEGNLVFVSNGSITALVNYSLGPDMKGKEPPPKKEEAAAEPAAAAPPAAT